MRKPQICKGGERERMCPGLVQFGAGVRRTFKRSRMRGRVMPSIVREKDRSREVAEGRLAPSPASLRHDARDPEPVFTRLSSHARRLTGANALGGARPASCALSFDKGERQRNGGHARN